jgi:apolipoprotein N-acyltransferase
VREFAAERLRSTAAGDVAAMACGLALVFAFAPFNIYPLAVLALASWFWLIEGLPPGRAFRRGFLFGVAEFGFGIYWIYISIHGMGKAPVWLALGIQVALVAWVSLYPAVVAWAAAWLAPAPGAWRRVLVLPALWTFAEWIRAWLLSGFPWLSLGYSQTASPLLGFAPVLGVFGISWAVALSAGLVLALVVPVRADWRRWVGMALGLVVLWAVGFGLKQVPWTHPVGRPIKVGLVQGNVSESRKWLPRLVGATLLRYQNLTESLLDSRIIIWPEAALPVLYNDVADNYLTHIEQHARAHGADVILGIDLYQPNTDSYYDSVVSLRRPRQFYRKRHLVPFAEYFPVPQAVRRWLRLMNLPYSDFTPGAPDQSPMQVAGLPASVSICYEDLFGEEIASQLPQAAFLINVSNDAWFGDSIALNQHLQISRMRAVETGRYLARATNTGITAFVRPDGSIMSRLPRDVTGDLAGRIVPYGGATPYVRWGNLPLAILSGCLSAAAAIAWWLRRRKNKHRR